MFDLDGTLAATGRDLANSVNWIRATLGLEALDDAYVYSRVGYGTEHLMRNSLPQGYENRFDEILDRFLKHYEEHLLDATVLIFLAFRGLTNYWLIGVRGVALYWYVVSALAVLVVLTQLSPSL